MHLQENQSDSIPPSKPAMVVAVDPALQAIAYSMDTLIPGFYLWLGPLKLRWGGSKPEETYPGTLHTPMGVAIVLPGYRIYSTYQGTYDP